MPNPLDLERVRAYCAKATVPEHWVSQILINGMHPLDYIREQFPATVGHILLVEYFEKRRDSDIEANVNLRHQRRLIESFKTDLPAAVAEIGALREVEGALRAAIWEGLMSEDRDNAFRNEIYQRRIVYALNLLDAFRNEQERK